MDISGTAGFERDEWIRRLRSALKQQNTNKAMTIVTTEIFGGAPLPSAISRFIPRHLLRPRYYTHTTDDYNVSGGSPEAADRLMNELQLLRASSTNTAKQFVATPINNDLFLWGVRLLFEPSLSFSRDLVEFYKKANAAPYSKIIR